ncbi:hypothetical protein ABPG74_008515 [Tetrahymena malaccensis]
MKQAALFGIIAILIFALFSAVTVLNSNKSYDGLQLDKINSTGCIRIIINHNPGRFHRYSLQGFNNCYRNTQGIIVYKVGGKTKRLESKCLYAAGETDLIESFEEIELISVKDLEC